MLVEGVADAVFVRILAQRLLPRHSVRTIRHEGKGKLPADPRARPDPRRRDLLHQLPAKLRAYGQAHDASVDRVVVLLDADQQDCVDLKRRLEALVAACDPAPTVAFCIAIEETEAFFLGDPRAIRRAYPSADLRRAAGYEQDSICGTAELLQRVLGERYEDKPAWAEAIVPYLALADRGRSANRSPSFHYFRRALLRMAGEAAHEPRQGPTRRRPRQRRG